MRFYDPAPASGWRRPLAAGLAVLDAAAAWAICVQVAFMVAAVSAQVLLRYAFNTSIGWADEISRLMFVWSIFLAIPLGIKLGVHIGIEMLTVRLPSGARDALARAVALAGCAMMGLVAYQAAIVSWDQWDEQLASMDASAALFILALAVGCAHSALHLAWIVLSGARRPAVVVATE